MTIDKVPETLKAHPYWCVWRREDRGGKTTKVPINPATGGRAQSNNPATFSTFYKAVGVCQSGGYDGVGIFGDIAAIDIDGCVSCGELSELAQDVVSTMNSYSEYSPSGTGIRVIFLAPGYHYNKARHYINNQNAGTEVYISGCTNKFVTITGDVLNAGPVEDRSPQITAVLEKYMRRAEPKEVARVPPSSPALSLSDDEVIQKAHAAKDGGKFSTLWNGDIAGYNSPSEADIALCNYLAFWCQCDASQMDRLFRTSGLMRTKWDRRQTGTTYGALTIQKAIRGCANTYDPNYNKEYTQPTKTKAADPPVSVKPSDYTDVGNARVYAGRYNGKVIYTASDGFLVWDGKRYDEDELTATCLMMEQTDEMLHDARSQMKAAGDAVTAAELSEVEDERRKAREQRAAAKEYRQHAYSSRNQPKIANALKLARTLMQVKPDRLNHNCYILNTPAGMVDLKTKQIAPHDPKEFCTKITKCGPGDKGRQMWLEFLDTISRGDEKMIGFLQQIAGMAVVGKVYEENLILALGDGRNGKSAFFNALSAVLNDYAGTISADILTTAGKSKGAELATLKGRRLVIAAETEEGARLSASMLKQIASTDKIHAERKYKDPEDFSPSHTTILYTNHAPKVGSTDTGTWRRLILIPFDAKIDGQKEVKNYADVLANEAGPAIMQWVIDGAYNYIQLGHKLVIPEFVHEAIERYQDQNDWLAEFLDEFCEQGGGFTEKARPLYSTYHDWSATAQGYARRMDDFGAEMEKRGFKKRKTSSGWLWHGVRLNSQQIPAYTYPKYS